MELTERLRNANGLRHEPCKCTRVTGPGHCRCAILPCIYLEAIEALAAKDAEIERLRAEVADHYRGNKEEW